MPNNYPIHITNDAEVNDYNYNQLHTLHFSVFKLFWLEFCKWSRRQLQYSSQVSVHKSSQLFLSKLCSVPWLVKSHWCKGYQKPGLQNRPFVSFSSWPQHLPHRDNSCYVQVKTNPLFLVPRQKEDLQYNHILILNQINLCICQPNF